MIILVLDTGFLPKFSGKFYDMSSKIKVGVLKETKNPPDRRVAITPVIGAELVKRFPELDLRIRKSELRCFNDDEYRKAGLQLVEDVSDADILIGVKEVDIPALIPEKTYLFFSHTAKKQPYNRKLLQTVVEKNITLIDYEYLTDTNHVRLVAFGRWAGIVGAYNGLRAWGERTGDFHLRPAHEWHDLDEMLSGLQAVKLPAIKILISGGGRVAHGAMETLSSLNLKEVSSEEFLNKEFNEPVVCRIDPDKYVRRKDGEPFDLQHFFDHPSEYVPTFYPYTKVTDLFIACHFWDPASPVFMRAEDMKEKDFKMQVIADVSCDIDGPIPSTLYASTIAEPFYGYNPETGQEGDAFDHKNITVMAVDNLPGELPRNASEDFGKALLENVLPSLFGEDKDGIIERATIVKNGKLTRHFNYLQDYLKGKE